MLNILILLERDTDDSLLGPLEQQLAEFCQVSKKSVAVLKNRHELEEILKEAKADVIVAVSHLPRVVATVTNTPVIGVPVSPFFGGLDALSSSLQMPLGNPVLTSNPDNAHRVAKFINFVSKGWQKKGINLVFPQDRKNDEHYVRELKRTREFAQENEIELSESAFLDERKININLIGDLSDVIEESCDFHVPLLSRKQQSSPDFMVEILKWVTKGGLWFGPNSIRNGLVLVNRLNEMRGFSLMREELPVLMKGSVKTIYGVENQSPYIFEFSDRYSIFDWGAMPDLIDKKGEALAFFANFFSSSWETRRVGGIGVAPI